MSFPRYPAYKDSGVEWLSQVPAHWEVEPCRAVFTERSDRNDPLVNEDYLSLMANVGVIPYAEKGDVGNKKPEDLTKCKLVFAGDLVINSMNYGIGSYGLSSLTGVCSPVYIVLKPKLERIEERFAFRILENKAFQGFAQSHGNGILEHRAAINWDILKGIGVPLPPVPEQQAILGFLDRETAKIDALVAEQEQLITLLKEKRQAVISHAVTKGLDPSAPMKDSGVKWLGDVPAHWCLGKVKQFFATTSGSTPNTDRQDVYYNGDIAWIRSLDLTDGDIVEWEVGITPSAIEDTACKLLPVGTVLVAMYGGDGTIGKNGLLRIPAATNQAICALLPSPLFENEFVLAFMQHQRPYWMVGAEGTRKDPNISQDRVRNAVMPCPPLSEQKVIVEHVRQALSAFGSLEKEAQAVIEILNERRFALISAAVTGQIDVRALEPAHAA